MSVTQVSTTKSGDNAGPSLRTLPVPTGQARRTFAEGTVLALALDRVDAERRDPRRRVAGFDNRYL